MNYKITKLTGEILIEMMPNPNVVRARAEIAEKLTASVNNKRIAGFDASALKAGIVRLYYNSLTDTDGAAAEYVAKEIVELF